MRLDCVLVAGGKWHDIDFARLELLKLLAEDTCVRVRVFEDYSRLDAILAADMLVTYTCDVTPTLTEQEALRGYVERGGRWFALHGTSSILRFLDDGRVSAPRWAPLFADTLGSQFIAHPPIAPFRVCRTERRHPLTDGIDDFDVVDELYLAETVDGLDVLLDCEFEGETPRFVEDSWPHARHPVLYLRHLGHGAVLYLTLGHCRGHYDMQPLLDWFPDVQRGAWDSPVYYDLLRRGLRWLKEPRT